MLLLTFLICWLISSNVLGDLRGTTRGAVYAGVCAIFPDELMLECWTVQDAKAYAKLRVERMNARMIGIRAKKAKEAEAAKEAQ